MTDDERRDEETSEESQEPTPADPGRDAEESAVDGEAASPSEEESQSESQSDSSSTSEGGEAPEASEDEAPEALAEDAATEAEEPATVDEPAATEGEEPATVDEPAAKAEKKADVIPGADLEPIAVEEEERPLSAEEQARVEAEEEERARREAQLTGEGGEEDEDRPAPRAPAKLEGDARYLATGKRKSAIARVTLMPGSGEIVINRRPLEEFFPRPLHQTMARQPLATTGYEGSVDVRVRVHGGGIGGQAGAVRHGIARALTEVDPELRSELKRRGFLTRDARVKERRKAGLKKARKRPQFSKR
jgi:small subunit ribosomal protein S9